MGNDSYDSEMSDRDKNTSRKVGDTMMVDSGFHSEVHSSDSDPDAKDESKYDNFEKNLSNEELELEDARIN